MKDLQALLAAAEHTPTFQAPDVADVIPLRADGSDPGALRVLVDRYHAHGFALAEAEGAVEAQRALKVADQQLDDELFGRIDVTGHGALLSHP